MKLFRNKFFLICLCIAVVLAAVTTTFSLMGYRGLIRDAVGTVTMPFRWLGTVFVRAGEGFGRYFGSVSALREENERLREENERLRAQADRSGLIEDENARLRDYLDMKGQQPTIQFAEATVIGREASNYSTVYTLNRGSAHGVRINAAVMTEAGLVGSVTEVGLTWCKVTTILENASSVGAVLPDGSATGIVSGDYELRLAGCCKLAYLDPADAEPKVGDVLRSSGKGSVYPPDVVIGTVTDVRDDPLSRSKVATVAPAVDFESLRYVMIITSYGKESS